MIFSSNFQDGQQETLVARLHRLYEQKKTHPDRDALLVDYVHRWCRWTTAGLASTDQ